MRFIDLRGVRAGRVLRRLYRVLIDDAATDSAAQLSYYFLFALFPLLFCLVTLTAYLPLGGAVYDLIARAAQIMPHEALRLLDEHLTALVSQQRPKLLTGGLLVALWSASRGVDAMRKALNLAYDVKESRPFWKTQLIAIGMTVAGALLVPLSFSAMILGGKAGFFLAEKLHVGHEFLLVWGILRWPLTALFITLLLALTYYLTPDVKQEFRFITPGSLLGTAVWLASTWGFTQYVEHFGKYNVTYGAIGSVIVLMTWLYITGLVFIIGGEVNAIVEHESVGGKARGARAAGEAPPPLEERPSAAPPGVAKSVESAQRSDQRAKQASGKDETVH